MANIATAQEMADEAFRRLVRAGVSRDVIDSYAATGTIPFTVDSIAAEYTQAPAAFLDIARSIEERDHVRIYYGLETVISRFDLPVGVLWGFLYVSEDKDSWLETASLDLQEYPAYVTARNYVSEDYPEAGEADDYGQIILERILVKTYFGGLVRIG